MPATFAELVTPETPQLVISFKLVDGQEQYGWGMAGSIPLLSLIGTIVRVQGELPLLEPGDTRHECPHPALVIIWDRNNLKCEWFVHPSIPVDSLLGMLETVKLQVVGVGAAKQQAARQGKMILGPDGSPMGS